MVELFTGLRMGTSYVAPESQRPLYAGDQHWFRCQGVFVGTEERAGFGSYINSGYFRLASPT